MLLPTRSGQGPARLRTSCALLGLLSLWAPAVLARPEIRQGFFDAFPSAIDSRLDDLPSKQTHCGVCHWDFNGGGPRNPHGVAVQGALANFPSTAQGFRDAVLSIKDQDPDQDGYSTNAEVTDLLHYANTPTFPGLTPGNVNQTKGIPIAEIQDYLVPTAGGDITPPTVVLVTPNGGETLTANSPTTIEWLASDASGVAGIDLFLSLDNGASFDLLAEGLSNSGSYTWFPANRPSTLARVRVEAVDNAFNKNQDDSDAAFTIALPPGGLVPSTLRDFDMPGTQPLEAGILNPPEACAVCHGNYDPQVEPYFNWQGSMMAQASRDPLFEACLAVANQDAPDSGDLCLRCHLSRGWLQGRSVPTDGTQMLATDAIGVSCDYCHRLVDPIPSTENPVEDAAILAGLKSPPSHFGTGMGVIDPTGARRGPFADADSGHPILVSPFHREAALCGTCHDVSNPAFEKDALGNYVANPFDAPATDFSPHKLGPVERTYSEWFYSAYNTAQGVYAPQFGGNKAYVATCQDCHMRDVTGQGCNTGPPVRTDLPLHDMTGGSTWLPGLLATMYPGEVNAAALQAGIERARYMLQNAAELKAVQQGTSLKVTVTNNTGHKLPTGYPEGRRLWINVKFLSENMTLLGESGAYDPATGVLGHDLQVKIYETEPGTVGIPGLPDGSLFHFVLNSRVFKDNRIPPRGFTNAAYEAFGGTPVGATYADGQYWDDTLYAIPPGTAFAEVTLYYQSTSKEYIEFLRDTNITNSAGVDLYNLWNENGKCPPELMATVTAPVVCPSVGNFDQDCDVDADDFTLFAQCAAGPSVPYPAGCDSRDLDGDGDIDQRDYGLFQAAYTGTPECEADADCDDGLFCNGAETCAAGSCESGTPPDCSGFSDQCNLGVCDEGADACAASPLPDGTACDNGDTCPGDTCQAGVCEPASCGEPFTLLANGVFDNKNGKDYYAGGPDGSDPLNDLRTPAEEQLLDIPADNPSFWWEARYEDLAGGTAHDIQALVQLRKEEGISGSVVIEVRSGGVLQASQTVPTANIAGTNNMSIPPTQVLVAVPALEDAAAALVNDVKVRVYVQAGNGKKLFWSYTRVTGRN